MKFFTSCLAAWWLAVALGHAQNPGRPPRPNRPPDFNGRPDFNRPPPFGEDGPPPFGPGGPPPFGENGPPPGRGPGGGPGGMGPMQEQVKLVKQFDQDGDQRLNTAERHAAREFLAKEKAAGRGGRRPSPRGGNDNQPPPAPGPKLSPSAVKSFPDAPLYDPKTLRTVFLEFENAAWESELADFYHTDVEVPAQLSVDGKSYPDVGVHFRGASSFFNVGAGRKRSLNLSLDFVHDEQRLLGYRTLNLLNAHADPTFLRSVLFHQIAREYLPAPQANFLRVVINGESWGVYVNVQQFNKDFVKDSFGTTNGARWKVPGSPRAQGGLAYLGENVADYRKHYQIKSKDDPKPWADLIKLCRVLNQTAPDKLKAALAPLLDLDGVLKFLALDNALINDDGYWVRTSDYSIYQDEQGRFHLIPQDANETFRLPQSPGGPGGGRGPGGGGGGVKAKTMQGVELDPLTGANDPSKPLLHKLLAVPALKARYLGYVRTIAEQSLDWNKLGPLAQQYQSLIAADVKTDTHQLDSFEAFTRSVTEDGESVGGRGPPRGISLKKFVEDRRAFLLNHPAVKAAALVVKAAR